MVCFTHSDLPIFHFGFFFIKLILYHNRITRKEVVFHTLTTRSFGFKKGFYSFFTLVLFELCVCIYVQRPFPTLTQMRRRPVRLESWFIYLNEVYIYLHESPVCQFKREITQLSRDILEPFLTP